YYYSLANKHDKSIDQFVTVSPVICNKLSIILPHRKADIHYCRFPVPSVESVEKENDLLKIIYCVRNLNEERKQFKILPLINERLGAKGLIVNWTIIGEGMNKQQVENVMQQHSLISFFPSLPNDRLIKLFPEHDLFILPSLQEGFPVAVVEAMKAGVVPLVTNWEEATKELIIENETGYYFKTGDANKYADTIELLNRNRNLLKRMAKNGVKKANELFDPYINTIMIEQLISVSYKVEKKDKKAFKAYGSRLDNPLMNNTVVNMVRKLKSRIN
ncbi:MAG: glycosyltransferase family 4 protein, partial [Ginsengibacter sp.]